ncbi:DUF418 domain-containing protein [Phaeobacter porticola]|uniref:Putative membrane protein n=1 Tax=Phaeobacter porticola TaxID=1844006 RepID=A0A1L3I9X6_9RHOB|nr:heparan-alpha-glucosaminide N-acetyltransferase domain-containing protein [Phaeobacter porticola]APG48967.1 putative membrane protein [Phaeobacter porticola]
MHPKTSTVRLQGLDLARYIAFAGMVIVNFKIAMGAEGGTGLIVAFTTALEGRAAACFVVLAGIGLGLAARRSEQSTISTTIRRATFLMALGLVNMVIFDADILHYYAIYFLLGAFLLRASTKQLSALVVTLILTFPVMIFTLDYDAGWDWKLYTYSDLWTFSGFLRHLLFNGWHPVVPWFAFLLFGIILSRLPLQKWKFQVGLSLFGLVIYLGVGGLSQLAVRRLSDINLELAQLVTTLPIPPMPLYMIAGLSAASIVIGTCLLLAPVLQRIGIAKLLVPAGRQTLTLYIAHILIGMGTLEELGLLGGQTAATALLAALIFCAFATVYALLWSRWAKHGPIEMAMRKIAG